MAFRSQKPKMCTDISWLLFFVLFLGLMIAVAMFALDKGNYEASINPYDSFGNICGTKHNKPFRNFNLSGVDTSMKPNLFFFATQGLQNTMKICVPKCLIVEAYYSTIYEYHKKLRAKYCRYDLNMELIRSDGDKIYSTKLGPCPELPVSESITVKRRCIPAFNWHLAQETYEHITSSDVAELFSTTVFQTRYHIPVLSAVAIVICVTLLVMLRWVKKISFWVIWTLVIGTNIGLCVKLWDLYLNLPLEQKDVLNDFRLTPRILPNLLFEFRVNRTIIFVVAVICIFTTEALSIFLILLRKQASKWEILLGEAMKCLVQLPELIVVPLIAVVKFCAFVWPWSYIALCITTASEKVISRMNTSEIVDLRKHNQFLLTEQIEFVAVKWIRNSLWLYIFGFLWICEFIIAFEQFWIHAAVAHWYFKKPIRRPAAFAVCALLKHHIGTIAKGSFLEIFKIPRLGLTLFGFKKLKTLNHTSYAIVAMNTIDFCSAAEIAWRTMAMNSDVLGIDHMENLMLFLGKLFVACLVCLIGATVLPGIEELYFYMAPVMVCTVLAFVMAHIVLSWLKAIMDTLVLCICEDRQINGHGGRWVESNAAQLFDKDLARANQASVRFISIRCSNGQPFRLN